MADDTESDEELEVPEEDLTILRGSVLFRGKKWLATKTASSKMGRSIIQQYIGPQGTSMLNALKSAAEKSVGPKQARKLRENILVLALKAKLLFDEKVLQPQDVACMAAPINELATKLHDNLRARAPDPLQIELLEAKIQVVSELVQAMFKPNMQEKNLNKLTETLGFFGTRQFLTSIIADEAYAKERAVLLLGVTDLVAPLVSFADLNARAPCVSEACPDPSMGPMEDFPGSKFCQKHQAEAWRRMTTGPPSLMHFLTDPDAQEWPTFVKEVKSLLPENSVCLLHAIANFAHSRQAIRRMFAEALYEKYISPQGPSCVALPPALVAPVQAELKRCVPPPPALGVNAPAVLPALDMYDAILSFVTAQLDPTFQEKFVKAGYFNEFKNLTCRA